MVYYYTYDLQVETSKICESNRLLVNGKVNTGGTITASDESVCAPGGVVNLSASSSNSGSIFWFVDSTTTNSIASGPIFSPNVSSDSIFYVLSSSKIPVKNVGHVSNAIGSGSNHGGGYYLIFDALKSFVLKTVKVYATGSKNRTFQLRDANGVVISEKTILVPNGESRVVLDWLIPSGTDFQLGVPTGSDLFRSNAGVTYPYSLNGLIDIKNSTAGTAFYYYLYDLEVQENGGCDGLRVPVSVSLDVCTGVNLAENTKLNIFPNPSSDFVQIQGSNIIGIELSDVLGKVIWIKHTTSELSSFDISGLSVGVYTIKVNYDDGSSSITKLYRQN